MPVKLRVTGGTVADCTPALPLLAGIAAEYLLADKGYDTDAIVAEAQAMGMVPVIPPRRHRKVQREYGTHLYRWRHLVENTFCRMKEWRGVATRYAKTSASFLAASQIRAMMIWAKTI